jgi:uncharacterized protein YrzB (UPF0473 family)
MTDSNKTKDEIEAEEDDEPLYITLEYDDGVVMETEVLGIFEADGKEYVALIPDDGSDDVYIYGYKESEDDEGEFELVDIDDDAEFQKAVAAFEEAIGQEEE